MEIELLPLVTSVAASSLAGDEVSCSFLAGMGFVQAGVLVGVLLPSKNKHAIEEECKDRSGHIFLRCL